MTKTSSKKRAAPSQPFVHLGERLLALGRIRSGVMSLTQAAHSLGVKADEIRKWQETYGGERNVSLREFRRRGPQEVWRLKTRVRRLAELIARTESEMRTLNQELYRSLAIAGPWPQGKRASSKEVA